MLLFSLCSEDEDVGMPGSRSWGPFFLYVASLNSQYFPSLHCRPVPYHQCQQEFYPWFYVSPFNPEGVGAEEHTLATVQLVSHGGVFLTNHTVAWDKSCLLCFSVTSLYPFLNIGIMIKIWASKNSISENVVQLLAQELQGHKFCLFCSPCEGWQLVLCPVGDFLMRNTHLHKTASEFSLFFDV